MMTLTTRVTCSWLGLLLFAAVSCQAAYVVKIPAKDEECFFVTSPKTAGILFGNYDQLDDGLSAEMLSVVIIDADNDSARILYRSRRGSSEGSFKVNLNENQKVQLCLQNGIWTNGRRKNQQNKPHDGLDRTVGLQFMVEPRNEALELQTTNSKLVQGSLDLTRQLGNLQSHQEYMRTREAMHRETVEGTFSRLLSWALLEGFLVIGIAAGQIMYLRSFIEVRRYI